MNILVLFLFILMYILIVYSILNIYLSIKKRDNKLIDIDSINDKIKLYVQNGYIAQENYDKLEEIINEMISILDE